VCNLDETKDPFQDKEYCYSELMKVREMFGNRNTTEKQYDNLQNFLGVLYFRCPDDIKDVVLATIYESQRRRIMFEKLWGTWEE